MEKILKNLSPIHVPQPKDNRISNLEKDLMKVKHVRKYRIVEFSLCEELTHLTIFQSQDYIISLAKGSEFPQAHSAKTNISKLLHDHQNKQQHLREEIKVWTEMKFYIIT